MTTACRAARVRGVAQALGRPLVVATLNPARIHVITVDDREAVEGIDRSEPVFLTRAAHGCLRDTELRLLGPFSPFLAPRCVRILGELLVQLNGRAGPP